MTLDPISDVPEKFKGITRSNVEEAYCYNVNHFAYINVAYRQPGPSDEKPLVGPVMLGPTTSFYEVYLTYGSGKPITVFCGFASKVHQRTPYEASELCQTLSVLW